jgi:hypothetical protein
VEGAWAGGENDGKKEGTPKRPLQL